MLLTPVQATEIGQLVVYAMDQHSADPGNLTPTPDPRIATDGWTLLGYLTGVDCLWRHGQTVTFGQPTCYGFLAQSIADPTQFAAPIRGTDGLLEWVDDGEFVSVPHPAGGRVEYGFFSIYQSLTYRPLVGTPTRAAPDIAAAVAGGHLTVIGHSLGSALATYLTFDIAALIGPKVSGLYFASPRPGNAEFVKEFDQRVTDYSLYNYELDVVPRVPIGPDYTDLPRVNWIGINDAQAKIGFDLACHHHAVCYLAMLNYGLRDWRHMPTCDMANASCIKGPR